MENLSRPSTVPRTRPSSTAETIPTICDNGGASWRLKRPPKSCVRHSLRSARLRVRGQDIPIEEMAPAAKRSVLVRPPGETGLAIEFVDTAGRPCHQDLDAYLDRGLNGEIQVVVLGCEASKVKNQVR
jgi:hypothetical protein